MIKILQGDCLEVLKTLPDESVDCAITSPPYWSLRDYSTEPTIWDGKEDCEHDWGEIIKRSGSEYRNDKGNLLGAEHKKPIGESLNNATSGTFCQKCGAWRGSLGLEPTFELYIKHLCDIFDEVKRVLKKEGTCWVNIGDTFASGGGASRHKGYCDPKYPNGRNGSFEEPSTNPQEGAIEKCLCQIPSRFAIEMTNRGWILRNEIIWHKRNCMPSSVTDRFTVDFEKVFFFVKSGKYYFEQILEPYTEPMNRWGGEKTKAYKGKYANQDGEKFNSPRARNTRANYPEVERTLRPNEEGKNKRTVWTINTRGYSEAHFATFPEALVEPMIKAGCPLGGTVLDIFSGSGTTGRVAIDNGRKYIGIELNPEYIKLQEKRLSQQSLFEHIGEEQ